MNMNENELYVVKEYEFDNPILKKIDSTIESCFTDCHNNYFHYYKFLCLYDIKFKNIANNEMINFTVSGKNMDLYDLKKN